MSRRRESVTGWQVSGGWGQWLEADGILLLVFIVLLLGSDAVT